MKRICFFIGDISATGGTERVTLAIANYLVGKGYKITILSYRGDGGTNFECNDKIELHSLHLEDTKGFIGRKIKPYISLLCFFSKNHYDVIINVDSILALYTLPLSKILKTKILAWEHFNYKANNGVKNRDRARRLAGKISDGIIVLTEADKDKYLKNLKMNCPIFVINNPINQKNCRELNVTKENIVIAVGRLTYQKNFQEMILIWNSLGKKVHNWKLKIIGSGEDQELLETLITSLDISNIELVGFSSNPEKYYNEAKVLLMTSRYEGMPMVLLEAQVAGVPIIAYDCFTGPSEIVKDGRNGYLIPYGDKKIFTKKLLETIENNKLINELSKNSLVDSQRFSIDKIGEIWEKTLESI